MLPNIIKMFLLQYRKKEVDWTKWSSFLDPESPSQVRIAEADNTAQYCPNLGSQQSAIVIRPVSPFASVKCWADDGGLCRLFELTYHQPRHGLVSALYQPDCHFYYCTQFRKYWVGNKVISYFSWFLKKVY